MGRKFSLDRVETSTDKVVECLKALGKPPRNGVTNILFTQDVRLQFPGKEEGIPFAGEFSGRSNVTEALEKFQNHFKLLGLSSAKLIENGDQILVPYLSLEVRNTETKNEEESACQRMLDVAAIIQMENRGPQTIRLEYNTKKCREILVSAGHELEFDDCQIHTPKIPASGVPGCAFIFMRQPNPAGYM